MSPRQSKGPNQCETPRLPHSPETERSILGAILLDNRQLAIASDKLRAADFFLPEHRTVFQQMIALGKASIVIDLLTLTDALEREGKLEAAGGAPSVAALADGRARVQNVEHHIRIVKDHAKRREAISLTNAAYQQLLAESGGNLSVLLST